MTFITIEQFKSHFKVKGKTAILSPQVAMIAGLCGHTDFDYQPLKTILEPTQKYDTVLIDILEDDVFPGTSSGHTLKWFNYAFKFLNDKGTLIGKFPSYVMTSLCSDKFQVNEVNLENDICFLKVTHKTQNKLTKLIYSTGESLEIDLKKHASLSYYNENAYQYIKSIEHKYSVENITFSGHDVSKKLEDAKEKAKNQNKFGLIIFNNIPSLRVEKLEQTKVTSGSNCYLFDSQEERDSYHNILHHPKVIALAKNLAYNKTMKIKVQSYLIHPSIFNYAV